MANSYKNIVITPNIGNTADPEIQFSGANSTVNTDISLMVYPDSNGTLSFEGSAGQLFSITNDLSNTLFSVSDVSGIPSMEVFANGLVSVAQYSGNVVAGANASLIVGTTLVANATGPYGKAEGALSVNNAVYMNGNNVLSVMESLRANRNISGGGTITVSASGDVLWSTRFIVISNGRGTHFGTGGYFDITCPVTGTITGVGGAANKTATAAGIPLSSWEALYYILPIGSSSGSLAANFRVASYTSDLEIPSTWVLVCVRNGDNGNFTFNNGVTLEVGQSYDTTLWSSSISPASNNASYLGGTIASSYDKFPVGTRLAFQQSAAPTGWTRDDTQNNKALRIVSGAGYVGTGGSVAFTTAFASQSVSGTVNPTTATNQQTSVSTNFTTATNQQTSVSTNFTTATNQGALVAITQFASHDHLMFNTTNQGSLVLVTAANYATREGSYGGNNSYSIGGTATVATVGNTQSVGGGGTHTHTQDQHQHIGPLHGHTQDAHQHIGPLHGHTQDAHDHTFTGTAINMAVQYVDFIIASKA